MVESRQKLHLFCLTGPHGVLLWCNSHVTADMGMHAVMDGVLPRSGVCDGHTACTPCAFSILKTSEFPNASGQGSGGGLQAQQRQESSASVTLSSSWEKRVP
jgi:hypothetical protein